uniref:Uncharacterized protein n=1 Tax=Arundo donax TaxID=35708 RepID=A0A0A9D0D6_ARUDO
MESRRSTESLSPGKTASASSAGSTDAPPAELPRNLARDHDVRHGYRHQRAAATRPHRRGLLRCRPVLVLLLPQAQQTLRDQEVERRRSLGMGYRRRQLRHLPQPHHGSMHRVPGEPGQRHQRGVHCRLGCV